MIDDPITLSEQAVIGGLLINPTSAIDICEKLSREDFTHPEHILLFGVIADLFNDDIKPDVVTVSNKLASTGNLERAGGLKYLAELANHTPSAANIKAYADVVYDNSRKTRLMAQAVDIQMTLQNEEAELKDRINDALSISSQMGEEDSNEAEQSFEDINKELVKDFFAREQLTDQLSGLTTGFNWIDKRLDGLQETDLIIVAARPAMGKTTYALNIAKAAAYHKPVVVFSMEMGAKQIAQKLWASHGVPQDYIKRPSDFKGKPESTEYATKLQEAVRKTLNLKMDIDDRGGLTPQQVRNKCLRIKKRHGELGLVVIDYLQLMSVNKSQGQTDKITQISQALKALAKELKCPIVCLSQLNRGVEARNDKHPKMSDLRDSGAIEQDADIIQFLYRDDYYAEMESREPLNPGITEVITAKFRNGEVGTDNLMADLRHSRFVEVDKDYNYKTFEDVAQVSQKKRSW